MSGAISAISVSMATPVLALPAMHSSSRSASSRPAPMATPALASGSVASLILELVTFHGVAGAFATSTKNTLIPTTSIWLPATSRLAG